MKNSKTLILLLSFITIGVLVVIYDVRIPCFFKRLTGIPCPGCGMTRAFLAILHGHLQQAIYYNILSIPLFFFGIWFIISCVKDLILHKEQTYQVIYRLLNYHYQVIMVLLGISWVVNFMHY